MVQRDPKLETTLSACIDGRIGRPVHAFQHVGSTMDVAHELAAAGAEEGTLVWATRQEQGRGRLGRTWLSPEGGLYISILLRPTRPPTELPQLSLVAGLAAAQAIQEHANLFPSIRWPNDLLINGKKVGGILVEASSSVRSGLRAQGSPAPALASPPRLWPKADRGGGPGGQLPTALSPQPSALYAVIGIGINVTTQLKDLPETATSLSASGAGCDPCQLTGALCRRFEAWYDVWTSQGFGPIREALRAWMGHFGQPVHINAGSSRFEGTATDLDESGRLLVRLDSGLVRAFEMGEVTLLR